MSQVFLKTKENFTCEHCGERVADDECAKLSTNQTQEKADTWSALERLPG
ncbi:MAG: hypothetical protein HYT48_03380 [Candidatus Vogelbacteria bacterium]|nr:hypothetical protein [Candidatus Vogelbacteria bacterium]